MCSQTELNATEAALIKKIETQRSRLRQKYYATEVIRHHIRLWRAGRGAGGMRAGMRKAFSAAKLKETATRTAQKAKGDFLYSLRAFKSAAVDVQTQVSNVQVLHNDVQKLQQQHAAREPNPRSLDPSRRDTSHLAAGTTRRRATYTARARASRAWERSWTSCWR